MKTTYILNTKINHDMSITDVTALCEDKILKKEKFYVCTTNPEFIVDSQKDITFREIINDSYLSVPDGSGVVFAIDYINRAKRHKEDKLYPIKAFFEGILTLHNFNKSHTFPPIYGTNLTQHLLELASKRNFTIGLIGGHPKDNFGRPMKGNFNIAKEASSLIKSKYPQIDIVVAESDINALESSDNVSIEKIMTQLNLSKKEHIDILLVAFGHNKQEKWIYRNMHNIPVTMCMGIGGTLDDIAGYTKTPPEFFSKHNLRWLYRLIKQPWRIKRILKATLKFPFLVFVDIILQQRKLQ